MMEVGGFFFDSELVSGESGPRSESTGEILRMVVSWVARRRGAVGGLPASRRRRWCVLGRLSRAVGGRRRGVVRRPARHRRDACWMA